ARRGYSEAVGRSTQSQHQAAFRVELGPTPGTCCPAVASSSRAGGLLESTSAAAAGYALQHVRVERWRSVDGCTPRHEPGNLAPALDDALASSCLLAQLAGSSDRTGLCADA